MAESPADRALDPATGVSTEMVDEARERAMKRAY